MRDGVDGEELRIAALQELLLPLREPSVPWGEVLARARVATEPMPPRRIRYAAISAAIAASLVLGWAWARRGIEPPPPTRSDATSVDVAAPPAAFELAEPPRVPVEDTPAPALAPSPAPAPAMQPLEAAKSSASNATGTRHRRAAPRPRASERASRGRDDSSPTAPAAAPERAPFEIVIDPGPRRPTASDCAADPSLAGCEEELPDTLSTTDIRDALMPIKELARACGKTHGGTPGDRVIIKFTVDGATGLVISSNARPPFEDTPLGRCVAEAVAQAVFPRFRKPKLGVMYPFEL